MSFLKFVNGRSVQMCREVVYRVCGRTRSRAADDRMHTSILVASEVTKIFNTFAFCFDNKSIVLSRCRWDSVVAVLSFLCFFLLFAFSSLPSSRRGRRGRGDSSRAAHLPFIISSRANYITSVSPLLAAISSSTPMVIKCSYFNYPFDFISYKKIANTLHNFCYFHNLELASII